LGSRSSPDRNYIARDHDAVFGGLAHVRTVIAEVGEPGYSRFDHVEVWQRGRPTPIVAKQRFATSTASDADRRAFLADLDQRRIGDALLMICGARRSIGHRRASRFGTQPVLWRPRRQRSDDACTI
jgi:hypothetical protein